MAYLALENGMVFEGTRIGAEGCAAAEIVFTTGVVGYLETLRIPPMQDRSSCRRSR